MARCRRHAVEAREIDRRASAAPAPMPRRARRPPLSSPWLSMYPSRRCSRWPLTLDLARAAHVLVLDRQPLKRVVAEDDPMAADDGAKLQREDVERPGELAPGRSSAARRGRSPATPRAPGARPRDRQSRCRHQRQGVDRRVRRPVPAAWRPYTTTSEIRRAAKIDAQVGEQSIDGVHPSLYGGSGQSADVLRVESMADAIP